MTSRAARVTRHPLLLGLAAIVLTSSGCRPPEPPPSVLLVVVDTLRPDRLGVYGHDRDTSPRLDRRAAEGAVFEHAFSTSSWTLPAIGSILTGQLPPAHGARSLGAALAAVENPEEVIVRGAKTFSRLRGTVPTLAEKLGARGYATAAVTSNPFLDPRFGLDRGFSSYDQKPRRRASAVTDRALAWLQENPTEPFFLLVHYMDPHLPYAPPAESRGVFTTEVDGSELDYTTGGVQSVRRALPDLSPAARAFLSAAYDEEILFVDRELERLFAGVEELDRWRDTLVVFTSDHGEELFEHGGFEHGHSLHDPVLRVPLVIWGPGVAAGRYDPPVSLTDVAPTVLAWTGGETDAIAMTGVSLRPLLQDGGAVPSRTLFAQDLLYGSDRLAAIEWPYKAIVSPEDGILQLFDLGRDPMESNDLGASTPAATGRLVARARAAAEMLAGPLTDPVGRGELDDGTLEELRALGYVE